MVKRAVIMAAGKGERLRPVTADTPKPLIRVNGVRMIDTVIDALHKNGIHEIWVVTGYLKERFRELVRDYPQIHLLENPWYESCNNISSLYAAREQLEDVMILDGDQIIHDHSILAPEFERSGYNAVWTDVPTTEWLMTVKDNIVTGCSRTGGTHGWQLYSISRWSAADGEKLRKHLELEFIRHRNTKIYWDDIPMFCHFDSYTLGIRKMDKDAVTEIDTIAELAAADDRYQQILGESSWK